MTDSSNTAGQKENAYRIIRRRMLAGPLRPGNRISQLALSRELGISRTPIREAIGQLVNEGLVDHVRHKGTFVRKPTRADLEDVYELREWLEGGAAAAAAQRINPEQIAQMKRTVEESRAIAHELRDSGKQYADESSMHRRAMAETTFHTTLMRASGNRRAVRMAGENNILSRIWGYVPEQDNVHELTCIYRDHARILRHIRHGDAEDVQQRVIEHVRKGRDSVLRHYDLEQRRLAMGEPSEATWSEPLLEQIRRMEQQEKNT